METNLQKSLGYETEEDFQDGVMLNQEDLNKRYSEVLEKERTLAKEQAKAEFETELKKRQEELEKKPAEDKPKETEQKPDSNSSTTESDTIISLKAQLAEMSGRLEKIDKYSTTAQSQGNGTAGKIPTGDGRPSPEPDNRFITKMMAHRNEFR